MSDNRVTDFVVEYQGAKDSSRVNEFNAHDSLVLDLKLYQRKQELSGKFRTFVRMGRGCSDAVVGGFLNPQFTRSVIDDILKVRNAGNPVGLVCISGYSKGAIYALRLAQELKDAAIEVRYIGLADLPIFPFGYKPAVPSFPDMIPLNQPQVHPRRFDIPPRTLNTPEITSPANFDANAIKKNYYQKDGNGVTVTKSNPRIALVPWWWSSNMPNGEIHGEVSGWNNLLLAVTSQANDSFYHNVGCDAGLENISLDISTELATI